MHASNKSPWASILVTEFWDCGCMFAFLPESATVDEWISLEDLNVIVMISWLIFQNAWLKLAVAAASVFGKLCLKMT